ncbi:ACP S-malonyltransferase [Kitasatospora sp. NPDC056138]|uniref:ACP S-malonyltransferase n=1 Tax=Kitasatospora sp. NPDC056138 TaxID=3345724 RepID=UPI0035DE14BE
MTPGTTTTALLFPGQGTQRAGMGEPWRDTDSWSLVPELSELTGTDVEELLLRTDDESLRRTDLAQIAVFSLSVLAHREYVGLGLDEEPPAFFAGHSLGEYTALVAAGALSYRDAAGLVAVRGRAMRAAAALREGSMCVLLGVEAETVLKAVEEARAAGQEVWVANLNAPGQVVISGTAAGLGHATGLVEAPGVKAVSIPVGGAFHSPLMAPAAEQLRPALAGVPFADGHRPVVANVDAAAHTAADRWPGLLLDQLVSPVRWEQSVRALTGPLGCGRLVELGPGRTLAGMARRISRPTPAVSLNTPQDLRALRP